MAVARTELLREVVLVACDARLERLVLVARREVERLAPRVLVDVGDEVVELHGLHK